MTLKKHFIILFSIFLGFTLDNLITPFTNPYFIELSLGFMIFSYWVFAIPEKLHSFEALIYGAFIDLFFGEAVGFHMIFFTLTSYITHVYVFRFRITDNGNSIYFNISSNPFKIGLIKNIFRSGNIFN